MMLHKIESAAQKNRALDSSSINSLTLSVPTGGPFGPPQFLGTRFLHNNKGRQFQPLIYPECKLSLYLSSGVLFVPFEAESAKE